jgi:hypothetical protein
MKYSLFFLLALISLTQLQAAPAQIILIRHAEKPANGNELSTRGRERAAALAPYFIETEQLITNGVPSAIYAMAAPTDDSSLRPIQTVTPLANELDLKIRNSFERDHYKKMVEEIKSDPMLHGKTVLICWEHTFIPEIARAFGALQAPGHWQQEVFDRVWLINIASNGKTTFQNIPQKLLFGDTAN